MECLSSMIPRSHRQSLSRCFVVQQIKRPYQRAGCLYKALPSLPSSFPLFACFTTLYILSTQQTKLIYSSQAISHSIHKTTPQLKKCRGQQVVGAAAASTNAWDYPHPPRCRPCHHPQQVSRSRYHTGNQAQF